MCLYSDTIYVPDMYAAVAADLGFPANPDLSLHLELMQIGKVCDNELSSFYERIHPLVENNIIKLYDPFSLFYREIAFELFAEQRWMTEEEINNSWPDLFVAEGILFSEKLGATYTAITSDEINAIRSAGKQLRQLLELERDTIAILAKISIPGFSADPKALVKARLDHEAFDDFRSTLRNLVRHMRSSLDSYEFDESVDMFQKDVINPQLSDLIKKCKRTHGLGENIKANAISFAAGGFSSLALSGDPATAVTAGALTALARAILQQLLAKKTAPPAARFFNHMIIAGQPNINVSRKWRARAPWY